MERYATRKPSIMPRFILQGNIPESEREGESVPETTEEVITKANDRGRQAREQSAAEDKIAKQEQKRRKAEDIKNVPPLPPCPGTKKLGGPVFTAIASKDGAEGAVAIWAWWRQVATDFPGRLYCYITRMHPAEIDKPKGERSIEKIYDFPDYPFAAEYLNLETFILNRYGSGNYKFFFNDDVLGGAVAQWYLNGIWDMQFPPIMELKDIDMANPNNANFIAELKRKRIIAGYEEKPVAGEPTNVQQIQQAQAAAAPLTAAIQTIASMAKDQRASTPDPSIVAESISKSYAKVLDTAMDAMKQTRELEVKGKDPSDHIDQLVKIATLITPKAPDIAAIMRETRESQVAGQKATEELAKELRDRDREERNALRSEIRELKQKPPEDPLAAMRSQIALAKELKDLFSSGGSDEEENPKKGGEPWWADMAKTLVPAFAPVIGLGVQALVKYVGNQPTAASAVPQAGVNPQVVQPQPSTPAPIAGGEEMNREAILWSLIGARLQQDYVGGKSGVDFALWFLDQGHMGLNQAVYSQLASLPKEQIIVSMQTYAPMVWQQVSVNNAPQPQFARFLEEFMDQQSVADARSGATAEAVTPEVVTELPRRVKRAPTVSGGGDAA